jgi:inosose dehydratase
MKRTVGCYSNAFGAAGVWAAAECLPATGINTLELALRGHDMGGLVIPESAVITERAKDEEAIAYLDHIQTLGVTVSGCNVGGANILSRDGLALTHRRIEFAARWFEVKVVVTGAGQPASPPEYRLMVDNLRRLGDTAGSLGITIALETHKGPTQNADAMLALMAEVAHPHVRINFDTGNIGYYNAGADVVAELEKVRHLVENVHLKDSRGRYEDWYFPALGDGGSVDFRRVREVLDSVGFLGPYTIEIEGIQGEEEPGLEGRTERVARSVRHLRECGYFD